MSLETRIGAERHAARGGATSTRGGSSSSTRCSHSDELERLAQLRPSRELRAATIDATWPLADGADGHRRRRSTRICAEADEAIADGRRC